jgi:hypothetical protein
MVTSYPDLSDEQKMKACLRIAESHARQARITLERYTIECENDYAILGLAGLVQRTKLDSGLDWYNFHARLGCPIALSTLKGLAFRTKPCTERTFNIVRLSIVAYRQRSGLESITIKDYRSLN